MIWVLQDCQLSTVMLSAALQDLADLSAACTTALTPAEAGLGLLWNVLLLRGRALDALHPLLSGLWWPQAEACGGGPPRWSPTGCPRPCGSLQSRRHGGLGGGTPPWRALRGTPIRRPA